MVVGERQLHEVMVPSGRYISRTDLYPAQLKFDIDGHSYKKVPPGQFVELQASATGEEKAVDDIMTFLLSKTINSYPAGTAAIDAAKVVSPQSASKQDVWPGWAGMVQLVQSGKLKLGKLGTRSAYIVSQKLKLPVINDALQLIFVVPKGVPLPEGDVPSSCVVLEETGEIIGRASCRNVAVILNQYN